MANDVKLQEGHPVDENLRPLKIGGKTTAIEIAQQGDGARVNGDLEVTGLTRTHKINTSIINGISATGDPALEIRVGEADTNVRRLDISDTDGTNFCNISHNETDSITILSMYSVKQSGTNLFMIKVLANGETHLQTTNNGDLILSPDLGLTGGDVYINNCNLIITTGDKLIFDGLGATEGDSHTYISQTSDDTLDIYVGGDNVLKFTETGSTGDSADFKNTSVGFRQLAETFSDDSIIGSGGTHDTHIDFRTGNKVYLAVTDDITNMNLIFPAISANFLLLLVYDGDHDVTNWKAHNVDANEATGDADVLWAGGSAPATTASGTDIFTFYWDAGTQKAYGVGSLGFAN